MRSLLATLLLTALPLPLAAQLAVSAEAGTQVVFSDEPAPIAVLIGNGGPAAVKGDVFTRLFQLSSATKIPLGEKQPWKELEVLAGQTVREKLELTFPALAEPALYRVEFATAAGDPLGAVPVRACPRNMLQTLARWSGERPLGVLDAGGKLGDLLKRNGVTTAEITFESAADFRGPLAILRSADGTAAEKERLRAITATLAQRGVAVLWLHPAPAGTERETRTVGKAASVCELALRDFDRLENSATAQMRLLESARFLLFPTHEPPAKSDP